MRATREDGVEVELHDNGTWAVVASPGTQSFAPPPRVSGSSSPAGTESAPSASPSDTWSVDDGFRGVPWGSPLSAAIAREGRQPNVNQADVFGWGPVSLAGLEWTAIYSFVDDRLGRGSYVLTSEFSNDNRYVREYESLVDLLKQKYGAPSLSNDTWYGDLYRDDPNDWGMAVGRGDLTRISSWSSADTEVTVMVSGENYEISLTIMYQGKALAAEQDRRNTARDLGDL